ncbi:DUF2793 domain-containing protein [Breoghania sp.]|uniref:DUF2793 domain-containing protein n=1 Tax=Breoghania sp. TaxID=2065378 RepID=UPI002AA65659|nr:DUF2793 domain-containing protein [Breoghania sp.]
MSDTARLSLPLMEAAQSEKHVTHNEALVVLDALVGLNLIDRDLFEPAGGESDGDAYLVASPATGDWAGEEGRIASMIDGGWRFYDPFDGLIAHVVDEATFIVHVNGGWVELASQLALQNLPLLGLGTKATETQRLAVKSDEVLYSHDDVTPGTGNMVVTLNKAADANDAGHAYKIGWQARALVGLFGDGDYRVKVSTDGASFLSALEVDHATGVVSFPSGVRGVREALSAARTYYVDGAGGDDTNDGMSAATAFATIQRGVDAVAAIDMAGHSATISVAAGTYPEIVVLKDLIGGRCIIQGATGVASDVIVQPGGGSTFLGIGISGTWDLRHMQLGGSTAISRCIHMDSGRLDFQNINFDTIGPAFNQAHIYAIGSAQINGVDDYAIIGGGGCHVYADRRGSISVYGRTITLIGIPDFTARFAVASTLGCVYLPNNTWSGPATGQRYFARIRGTIFVNGAGALHLPGDAAGTLSEDGWYV